MKNLMTLSDPVKFQGSTSKYHRWIKLLPSVPQNGKGLGDVQIVAVGVNSLLWSLANFNQDFPMYFFSYFEMIDSI